MASASARRTSGSSPSRRTNLAGKEVGFGGLPVVVEHLVIVEVQVFAAAIEGDVKFGQL